MRKIVLLLTAAMVMTAASFAQDAKTIGFGLKAGANFSSLKDKFDGDTENSDMKVGFHGGAFVNLPIGTTFAIQPELVYSIEGGKEEEGDYTAKANLSYLNIPVMFQYTASGFYAETGPQIGFLMSAKLKEEEGGQEDETDIKDFMESTNFSWGIGLGYKLPSGLGFGARYNLGLSNLNKDGNDDFSTKANTIQVGLSYTFGSK